ncbi:MAG: DUF2617 family protein [Isosphaeraceae bacterium]|nr:DUF2617 family protein [Isosphaeraceae bacterium]
MSLPPPDPRPKTPDLAFRVYGRAIHPDWFAVKAHRRFVKDGWTADVRIIDRGHVVIWSSGETRLSEVLLRDPVDLPREGLLSESKVRGERITTLRPAIGVEYQSIVEVERNDPEIFSHLSEEIRGDDDRGGLSCVFPPSHRFAPSATSRIVVEARARGLLIHTFHTFPDERSIVRTQSLFETKLALSAH